jgi:hypothetical protein
MMQASRRLSDGKAACVLAVALLSCGGGDKSSATAKSATGGSASHDDDSIAEVASREGLPTLGGGGQAGGGTSGSLRLELVDKENPIRLDGTIKEWTLVPAHIVVKGTSDTIAFKCALAYDAQNVYFAGDVTGVKLRHLRRFTEDEDHASLVVAAPGAAAVEITFFPGKPGESAGVVRSHGQSVPGAKIVEAETDKGYSFEAQLPWSALAPPNVRVALRGVARFHDGTRAILATGSGDASSPRDMPALPTESEEALVESFLVPKGLLATTPKFELLADVRGDAMKERIAVYDRYVTVVGPNYRDGKEFFFRDVGSDIDKLEARDITGRGKQDLVLHRQFGGQETREWVEVWAFLTDEPTTVFSHEISVAMGTSHVTNAVRLATKEIEITYEPPVGFDASSYNLARAIDTEPVLLPWGAIKSQTFRFDGSKFVKAKEVSQPGTVAATTTSSVVTTVTRTQETAPVVQRPADVTGQLLGRYRADRGVPDSVRPKVDVQAHVDGDARPERVLLIGRDIVVFGPGFKGGNAYAYLTLSQFNDASDIEEMTTRDLTGDGAAELIVRGVRHLNAQGAGAIDMHVMFVYQLKSGVITRIFGIETARAQGTKRIQGTVQLVAGQAHATDVDVHVAHAQGWTDKTYPFTQDQPGGALEPLLLPWGGIDHVRYAYNGTAFARSP